MIAELQIRGGIEDNSKIMKTLEETFLMMGLKICFYGKMGLIIPELSLLSLLIWSTVR